MNYFTFFMFVSFIALFFSLFLGFLKRNKMVSYVFLGLSLLSAFGLVMNIANPKLPTSVSGEQYLDKPKEAVIEKNITKPELKENFQIDYKDEGEKALKRASEKLNK